MEVLLITEARVVARGVSSLRGAARGVPGASEASAHRHHCHKHAKGMGAYTAGVAKDIAEQLKGIGASFEILSPDQLLTYLGDVA